MNKKEQELQWWKDWSQHSDKKARNKLLKSLDPLLHKEVNKYVASPLPRTAIETEARMLALNAFNTYDPNKAQLNTHVMNHLKHLQRYALTYQNVGKIPEHRGIAISKYQHIKENLAEDLQREPTIIELADALSWTPAEVERMQRELRKDLSIVARKEEDEDSRGFFDYTFTSTDPLKEAIEFVYFDSSMEDKKILEYVFGLGGKQILAPRDIALKINRSETYIKKRLKILAQEIQNVRL